MSDKPIRIRDIHNFNVYFTWGQEGCGFGEYSLSIKDGKLVGIDNECMGPNWSRKAFHALIDKVLDEAFDVNGDVKK